jgi:putative phosphoribosyl transferase
VLGIVSGGAPVAAAVARHLKLPLDWLIIRRLLTPHGPGSQSVAVNVAGTLIVESEIATLAKNPQTPLGCFIEDALTGLAQRTQTCRGQRHPAQLAGKPILIVDCGIRTGLTMEAAVEAARSLQPSRLTVAVPVTSTEGGRKIREVADELFYLAAPEPFGNAGMWFKDFGRQTDDSLSELLSL